MGPGKWIEPKGFPARLVRDMVFELQPSGPDAERYECHRHLCLKNGRIEGTVQGDVLRGKWYQSNGSGSFEFRLSADGRSFLGRWGTGQTLTGGSWNGTRE